MVSWQTKERVGWIPGLTAIKKALRLIGMTDHDRNIRTLVICFVLAVMALIPLRFVESGDEVMVSSKTQILGETIQQEVILPNAELDLSN